MGSHGRACAALLVALGFIACKKTEPAPAPPPPGGTVSDLRVTDIDVGRSATPDQGIAEETNTFQPADNFFVAVKTEGTAPQAKVAAVWSYEDQRVTETEQTIQPQGPAVVTFELPKPDGPNAAWPSGDYKVKILLNGVLAGSENFEVRGSPSK
jgi:hypothetical protein